MKVSLALSGLAIGMVCVAPAAFADAGRRYAALVPDTLDLTFRGEWALNALTEMLDRDADYEVCFHCVLGKHDPTGLPTGNPKYAESLPMMRVMSGCDFNMDVEEGMTQALVKLIHSDGLYYAPFTPKRPWHGADQDFANPYGQARCLLAMMARYQVDASRRKEWGQRIQKMVDGLAKIAIYKHDYAYFPKCLLGEVFSYGAKTGWCAQDEPAHDLWAALYTGGEIRALSRWYAMSGDKTALELARKLTNFLLKPDFWTAGPGPQLIAQSDHAWFHGHFHAYTLTLRGLLEYAIVTNDVRLKEFVRDGYEFGRLFGVAKVGYFPEFTDVKDHEPCEPCCIANMIALAIKLSDQGIGDYWDHVDQYVRNHFADAQLLPFQPVHPAPAWFEPGELLDTPNPIPVVELPRDPAKRQQWMNLGGWGIGCCTANCSQALYYAWESIVRGNDGDAKVNLLLNRASEWLDVNSYLPHEGKVEIVNKQARTLSVRIPGWVDRKAVKCSIGGRSVQVEWVGNRLVFSKLGIRDKITIGFPMTESTEVFSFAGAEYTCHFRGNTLLDADVKGKGPWQPRDRKEYRGDKAPIKKATRYVPQVLIEW